MKKIFLVSIAIVLLGTAVQAEVSVSRIDFDNDRKVTARVENNKDKFVTIVTSGGTFHVYPCGQIDELVSTTKTIRENSFPVTLTGTMSGIYDTYISTEE